MKKNSAAASSQRTDSPGAASADPPFIYSILIVSLFTLWPLLNFANENREQLDAGGLLVIGLVFAAFSIAAIIGLRILDLGMRRRRRVGATAATAIFILLFFSYYLLYDRIVALFASLGLTRGENYAYLVIVIAACLAAYFRIRSQSAVKVFLAFGALTIAMPALGLMGFFLTRGDSRVDEFAEVDEFELIDRPNVIHIVLDGYARHDSLSETIGYDNESFLDALERRDFFIARDSYANYPTTFLSLSSTVRMNYPATETTPPFQDRTDFYDAIRGNNPVSHTLRKHGYRYAYLGSAWWDGSKCGTSVDVCLSTTRAVRQALLAMTPLRRFVRTTGRSIVGDIAARLDEIFARQPVYLFAHILAPHPPRTFTSSCAEITSSNAASDGNVALTFWGDKDGYIRDLECTNDQVLALVDDILDRDPSTVILVHGDHGTAFAVDWSLAIDAWPDQQVEERFAILMAVRLPKPCESVLYPSLSPVNLYRALFACLGHVEPQMRPDVLYVSPSEKHPEYGKAHPYRRFDPSSAAAEGEIGPTAFRPGVQ